MPGSRPARPARRSVPTLWLVSILSLGACTGEEAVPIEQITTTRPASGAHVLEPNDEMLRLAEQQCRDDPELDEGGVRAVDPANPEEILAEVTVDCAEVR